MVFSRLGLGLYARLVAAALVGLIVTVVVFIVLNCPREQAVAIYQDGLRRDGAALARLFTAALVRADGNASVRALLQDPARKERISALLESAVSTETRLRLFDGEGALVFDSGPSAEMLARSGQWFVPGRPFISLVNWWSGSSSRLPERSASSGIADFPEALSALAGAVADRVFDDATGAPAISIGLPVQIGQDRTSALVMSVSLPNIAVVGRLGTAAIACAALFGFAASCLILFLIQRQVKRSADRVRQVIDRIVHREAIVGPIEPWADNVLPPMASSINLLVQFLKERADEADLFAKEMAHELKNPLTSLRSAVETAERITDPEQHRRLMSVIVQDVVRLDRLISAITELSRVEAELAATPDEQVDVEAMLSTIVEIENAASHDPLDPQFTLIGGGGSFVVRGVESRMAQVFGNILRNASSFSPPGSTIRVAITRRDNKVTVTCDDNGPGIPEGKEDVIFQRFYSDRPVDQPFAGHSGLGLSLCRQIVTAHAGQVRAENRHDALERVIGARFTVTLPAAT